MTVSNTASSARTTGNGITTSFPANIKIFDETDIVVQTLDTATDAVINTLILNDAGALGYTVTFDTEAETLTVDVNTAPLGTEDLFIDRDLPLTQGSDFPEANKFPAILTENSLDKLTLIAQDIEQRLGQALTVLASSSIINFQYTDTPIDGRGIKFDGVTGEMVNTDNNIDDILTLAQTEAANAATSASNAATSETNAATSASNASTSEGNAATSEANAAASALAAQVAKMEWQGSWVTATAYALNDVVEEGGSSYICISAHTSGVFATDLAFPRWELVAQKGADGAGTGDLISTNNLSDVANAATSRANLGLAIGTDVQAFDANNAVTDAAQTYTQQQNFGTSVLADAANIAWDLNTAQVARVTLNGNRTLDNPTNMVDGGTYILEVIQGAGGNHTLAYDTAYQFPDGTAPVLSTGAGDVDIITFVSNGSAMRGIIQKNFS